MGAASERQIEADSRTTSRATGPKTPSGKARSRANSLRHGLAAKVLVPEQQRAAYEATLARWDYEAGPSNVVERHLVRRAAVASVTLDRLDEAREETREDAAREAVGRWERKKQHAARRKAQDLAKDPAGVVADLEASAFGCDWLIRQWAALDGVLAVGGEWAAGQLDRAQQMLGYPAGQPGPDADRPVRLLWLLAGVISPTRIGALRRTPAEAADPTEPDHARARLRRLVAEQVDRLEALRDEAWEAVEGPERRAVVVRAAAADTSKEGQLRHRYAKDADRSHNAAMRLFLHARRLRCQEDLAIAKEAGRQGDTPRVPVGGGWWHEVGSDPAPPGFARIDPFAAPVAPDAGPMPAPSPITPEAVDLSIPDVSPTAPPTPAAAPGMSPGDGFAPSPTGTPGPIPATAETTDTPADRPSRAESTSGAPRRSEPISPANAASNPERNPNSDNLLRDHSPTRPINDSWRTEPLPGPARPGRPPADRPPATSPLDSPRATAGSSPGVGPRPVAREGVR